LQGGQLLLGASEGLPTLGIGFTSSIIFFGLTSSTLGLISSTFGFGSSFDLVGALGVSKISPQSVMLISTLVAPDWLP
jgi:hypothetical protein